MQSGHAILMEHAKDKVNSDIDLEVKPHPNNEGDVPATASSTASHTDVQKTRSEPSVNPASLMKEQPVAPSISLSSFLMRDPVKLEKEREKERELSAIREKEEAYKKTKDFLQIFPQLSSRTPENERLIGDFSCAFQKEKLFVHGRMYISENHLCFHSTIFGETKKVINLSKIRSMQKRNTAILFPNAIEIFTKTNKKYFFSSFIFRDQAFSALNETLERFKRDKSKHTVDSSSNETSDPIGSSDEEIPDEFAEDSEHEEETQKTAVSSSPEDKSSSSPVRMNQVAENADLSADGVEQQQQLQEDPIPEPSNITLPPLRDGVFCEHFDTQEKREFHISEPVPIDAVKFFQDFLDDRSDFIIDFHKKQNYKDHTITNWTQHSNNCCFTRVANFISPVKARLGPKSAPVQQTLRCCLLKPGHLVLEALSETKDVPYGDSFVIINYFELIPDASNRAVSVLRTYSYVKFVKNIWAMKSIIEKTCIDGSKEYCAHFVAGVRERVFSSASLEPKDASAANKLQKSRRGSKSKAQPAAATQVRATENQRTSPAVAQSNPPTLTPEVADLRKLVLKELENSQSRMIIGGLVLLLMFMLFLTILLYNRVSYLEHQMGQISLQQSFLSKIQQLKDLSDIGAITQEEHTALLTKLKESDLFLRFKQNLFS